MELPLASREKSRARLLPLGETCRRGHKRAALPIVWEDEMSRFKSIAEGTGAA